MSKSYLPVEGNEPRLARLELEEHVLVEGSLPHATHDRPKCLHLVHYHRRSSGQSVSNSSTLREKRPRPPEARHSV